MHGSDNEIYLLIKYIKSLLWRVVKRLSYIQDARCLKVNDTEELNGVLTLCIFDFKLRSYNGRIVSANGHFALLMKSL